MTTEPPRLVPHDVPLELFPEDMSWMTKVGSDLQAAIYMFSE